MHSNHNNSNLHEKNYNIEASTKKRREKKKKN